MRACKAGLRSRLAISLRQPLRSGELAGDCEGPDSEVEFHEVKRATRPRNSQNEMVLLFDASKADQDLDANAFPSYLRCFLAEAALSLPGEFTPRRKAVTRGSTTRAHRSCDYCPFQSSTIVCSRVHAATYASSRGGLWDTALG